MNHKKTCCVCFTSEKVHKFPHGKFAETTERFATWANFAALENVLNHQRTFLLCEKHFEKRMFMNDLSARLVKPAFPTLHPPVYHGPRTMDNTPVGPSVLKSETFQKIYEWKEASILSSNLVPESVVSRAVPYAGPKEKPMMKIEDSGKVLSILSPVNSGEFLFTDINIDILSNNAKGNAGKRPASPTINSSEIESIKNPSTLKTYSRRNKIMKQDTIDVVSVEQNPEVLPPVACSSNVNNNILTPIDTTTSSSVIHDRDLTADSNASALDSTSALLAIHNRLPSPIITSSTTGNIPVVAASNSTDTSSVLLADDISTYVEMKSTFTDYISILADRQEKETDLLSEAINNADISFSDEAQFCTDPKKRKDYDPVLNSILDDMSFVENLIIYYY